jgi:hypothetical protein
MRRVTDQEYPPLPEALGHQLSGLPVGDVHDLHGQIRFADAIQHQLTTALGGVLLRGFCLDQKHAAISIGDQEEALDTRPLDAE